MRRRKQRSLVRAASLAGYLYLLGGGASDPDNRSITEKYGSLLGGRRFRTRAGAAFLRSFVGHSAVISGLATVRCGGVGGQTRFARSLEQREGHLSPRGECCAASDL